VRRGEHDAECGEIPAGLKLEGLEQQVGLAAGDAVR